MSISENYKTWEKHNWSSLGEEWNQDWEDDSETTSENLFYNKLLPFIGLEKNFRFNTILEIAPGHGRMTKFLINHCDSFIGVDLSDRCTNFCKERFNGTGAIFLKNDGLHLPEGQDSKIDFIFSYDSLVHAGNDVLESYIIEAARYLSPYGFMFLHYSNRKALEIDNDKNWRNKTMDNKLFISYCEKNNLTILNNEIIDWRGSAKLDCFTLVQKDYSPVSLSKSDK